MKNWLTFWLLVSYLMGFMFSVVSSAQGDTMQVVLPVANGVSQEMVQFFYVALTSVATMPLTSLLKLGFKSEGKATAIANAILNALVAGVAPAFSGLYGTGFKAIALGVLGSVGGALFDKGFYHLLFSVGKSSSIASFEPAKATLTQFVGSDT
jgi:hypothetical protein